MALVIEDGTGKPDAQAYADAATVIAYALLRGITIADDANLEPQIVVATDYLESLEYILQRYSTTQALEWPRNSHCFTVGTDLSLPQFPRTKLEAATAQLVIEQRNGVILQPTTAGSERFVTEERVDVILTRYSEKLGTLDTPTMRIVNSLLRDLVVRGSGTLRSVRV